jgi:hypothetical protein
MNIKKTIQILYRGPMVTTKQMLFREIKRSQSISTPKKSTQHKGRLQERTDEKKNREQFTK